jgi:hypothetical protein
LLLHERTPDAAALPQETDFSLTVRAERSTAGAKSKPCRHPSTAPLRSYAQGERIFSILLVDNASGFDQAIAYSDQCELGLIVRSELLLDVV